MPTIIQDEKQKNALKRIEEMLSEVENLNYALQKDVTFSVNAAPKSGKAVKIDIIDEKDAGKITAIIDSNKKKLAKEILLTAKTYRIALSEKEEESLK